MRFRNKPERSWLSIGQHAARCYKKTIAKSGERLNCDHSQAPPILQILAICEGVRVSKHYL